MVMPFSFSSSMESMVAPTSSLPRTCAQPLARQQNAIKKMSKHGAAHTYTHTYTHTHTHMRERVCRWWWSTDLVHFFDAASVEEDALGQGGFARVNVGRDANVANLLNGVCCGREGNGERGEERECVCVCVCVCYALPHHTHTHTHTNAHSPSADKQTGGGHGCKALRKNRVMAAMACNNANSCCQAQHVAVTSSGCGGARWCEASKRALEHRETEQ